MTTWALDDFIIKHLGTEREATREEYEDNILATQ